MGREDAETRTADVGSALDAERGPDMEFERLYTELRALARMHLAGERGDHTLQATALVHEAYIRLSKSDDSTGGDSGRFCRAATRAMRQILIDHARKRRRIRRGGRAKRLSLDALQLVAAGSFEETMAVEDAIERLEQQDPKLSEIVRLRFYAGLSVAEIAKVVDRSERTVHREWSYAKAWLFRSLRPDTPLP